MKAYWKEDALERRRTGKKTLWKEGALEIRRSGKKAYWKEDALEGRRSGKKALWKEGALEGRRSGKKALWKEGALERRRSVEATAASCSDDGRGRSSSGAAHEAHYQGNPRRQADSNNPENGLQCSPRQIFFGSQMDIGAS